MRFSSEFLVYAIVKSVGFAVSHLPIRVSLALGRFLGTIGYHVDVKHRSLAYANLKIAFGRTKQPHELKRLTKKLFQNFGQNLFEVFNLPRIQRLGVEKFVTVEGREHVFEALKKKKGVILLAMHFGSWEISSLMSTILGHPYKVIVKTQEKFSQLDELLNSYRQCGGSVVVARGRGTRELIESLDNNGIVGMVVDQGGRDGTLVKFFGRNASMSIGAIRMGLKSGIPICLSILIRDKGPHHRLVIDKPLQLINTEDTEADIKANLAKIIPKMERYIRQYPSEYMWFYKIWKYSNESKILIVSDGKAGHLHQSQTVAKWLQIALSEREINSQIGIVNIRFKNAFARFLVKLLSSLTLTRFPQGRIGFLRHFICADSFQELVKSQGDFIVSCGSSVAGINFLLSQENQAKSISVLRPSYLSLSRFNLVVLPRHDALSKRKFKTRLAITNTAPNLITEDYLKEQADLLTKRYSHLKDKRKFKIGVLLGGDTKDNILEERQIRVLINQIKEASNRLDADILMTTSRRTSPQIESMVQRALKIFDRCPLLIIANRNNVPEAIGGILGLSDIIVVSGDSISMVSEAVSSGKNTIAFPVVPKHKAMHFKDKHRMFIDQLHTRGHLVVCKEKMMGKIICDMAKNKIKTKALDDNAIILEAVRHII